MKMETMLRNTAIVVAGVVIAGYLMNALRDNDIVRDAIRGYDA